MNRNSKRAAYLLRRPGRFSQAGNIILRPYQEIGIQAVVNSVRKKRGMSFVWIFPRQSGKDEALAILVQYMLALFKNEGGEMVFFNPTFKPQTETSMRRLETRLNSNILTLGKWKRRSGYIYQVNNAYCTYLSADPTAHVVSATANRLLVINEAQDVGLLKYDKDIDPMAASTNATKLFSGTRWTGSTLLEREYQLALKAEKQDRLRRVFFFTADDVRAAAPEYGKHVDGAIARLGRQHPLVKTQYFCETIEAQAGMFPPGRQALMRGSHSSLESPVPGRIYAFLIDVAGQDESRSTGAVGADGVSPFLLNPGRDSTNLKIVEVDMSTVSLIGKPSYLTMFRKEWTGASHVTVFGALRGLVQTWKPMRIVIDATGVGEGLWSLLDNAFGPDVVIPVKFSARLKSELGYGFIGIIESGRYREYHPFPDELRIQLDKCRSEIVQGPSRLMRWGVPDGTRDEASGALVHDDDLITGAMCTLLDRLDWRIPTQPIFVYAKDPLEGMDRNYGELKDWEIREFRELGF
ncbi:MAG: hypothetical protein ABSF99_00425 [Anaerolineales bacterium]|jgi:hypothetical protein